MAFPDAVNPSPERHPHHPRIWWQRRWPHTLALGAVALFAVLTTLNAGEAPGWTAFDNIGETLAAAFAAVACVIRARREYARRPMTHGVEGRAWLVWSLIAAGVTAWAIGQAGWTVWESGFGVAPPSPSPLDIFFLAFPVLVVIGLLGMVQTPAGVLSQLRGALEGLFIAGGSFLFCWVLIITPQLGHSTLSPFGEAVNLAYPTLDGVVLGALLFVGARGKHEPLRGILVLAAGLFCLVVSDIAFWYFGVTETYQGVNGFDTGWVAGFVLIGIAALSTREGESAPHRYVSRGVLNALPSVFAGLGLLAVLTMYAVNGSLSYETSVLVITAVVLAFGAALYLVVIYENEALTTNLHKRTADLRSAERYFRALAEHSSDVVMVVEPDYTIGYLSDSVFDVFGYRPDEVLGRELNVFGRPAAEALTAALDRSELTPMQTTRVEWLLNDAMGRVRHAESSITNLLDDPHITAFVINTRDTTEREALADQLRHQAFHDPLTGLANRALLNDRAGQAFARSLRSGSSVAVIVVDVDAFKQINDNHGHEVGDELLRAVARRLQGMARPEDTVARIGGDEFVVLIDAVKTADDALKLAERLHEAIVPRFAVGGGEEKVTVSVGVACGTPKKTNFEQLLCDADVAMYAVKSGGKDAVELFRPSMQQQSRERYRLQADLRKALERNELWLLYQPEFDLASGRLKGFEALTRWNHPTHGLIGPERFIPIAEESGLIVPLGRWVLDEALRQAVAWDSLEDGPLPLTIAVNVSGAQLKAPSFTADVKDAVEHSGIDPVRVVLEVTETALVEDSRTVIDTLHALKDLGVRIAIDDFGTGYASFAYLRRVPVDILKVDKSFVASSSRDRSARELLEAIVGIGRTLSLVTIGEGIEEPEQLATLKDIGCDLAQGYLLSRPLSVDDAGQLIAEHVRIGAKAPSPDTPPAVSS